jgi:hypothetical protein
MFDLYQNSSFKKNLQNIINLLNILKKIEVAVSKGLTKESINEFFK